MRTKEEFAGVSVTFLAMLALFNSVWAAEAVHFGDAALKAAVEEELWTVDPTAADMLALTSLDASGKGITALTGLEYAANLRELRLEYNQISDISPLSGLSRLKTLVLNNNRISDISLVVTIPNLEYLDLHDNHFSDLWALSSLSKVQTLIVRGNHIRDVCILPGLSTLRNVDLNMNEISDISCLASMVGLENLDLRNNPLSQQACSVYIPQIVANNPTAQVEPSPCQFRLTLSAGIGGSVISPGEGEFVYSFSQMVQLQAQADPYFVFTGWSGTYFSRLNPASLVLDHDYQIQASFQNMLTTIYVDDDGPDDPGPGDPAISDPQENGTAEHPFDGIQEAIDVAIDRATIVARTGTYRECIDVLGKRIELTGFNPNNPGKATWPVIDGGGSGPVVSFMHGENPNCVLRGFVITSNNGTSAPAIRCFGSSPTIANCLIVGNRAMDAGRAAIYCTDSNAILVNCTVAGNYAGINGAALYLQNSSVQVVNSILWGNTPNQIISTGDSMPSIRYSCIAGGWPGPGSIDANPLFARAGTWVNRLNPDLVVTPDHPDAMFVMGDYHLQSQASRWDPGMRQWVQDAVTSPCIDAGDPASPVGDEPVPNGGIIDMGAYGGTAEAGGSTRATASQ
jgi:hypothetical protein